MKIGDKVRFLNEVGGGTVTGFQGKDIVVVRDGNGFDIPMLARECIVIETDDYNIARPATKPAPAPQARKPQPLSQPTDAAASPHAASSIGEKAAAQGLEEEKPITFKPRPQQRRGGDTLNIHLGFVKLETEEETETAYEVYLINDSNYDFRFGIWSHENGACTLLHEELAEANTKIFLCETSRAGLAAWERITLQGYAFKERMAFLSKPAVSASLRIEGAKFFKPGAFKPGLFFNEPALVFDAVRDDKPVNEAYASAEQVKAALLHEATEPTRKPAHPRPGKPDKNALLEIDLHASELLETTAGMQARDILEYQLGVFRRTMDEHLREKGRKIVFIHGKGDGVLRAAILKELRAAYKSCTWQDASFREYGFGATMVCIH